MAKNPYDPPLYQVTRKGVHGKSFTMLVGRITHGEDPAQIDAPPTNRGAVSQTVQEVSIGRDFKGSGHQLRLDPANTRTAQSASFVVNNNTFTGATYALLLGNRKLQINVDWVPGGSATATATAIVAAINAIGGPFAASNVGGTSATVTISCDDPMLSVPFRITGSGPAANFTSVTPSNGFMAVGSPYFEPPVVT